MMFFDSGTNKKFDEAFWRTEINETIQQIASQQGLLTRCHKKLFDLPQQLIADKKKYDDVNDAHYPLQYAHAQDYLFFKKQYAKSLITKLRFLIQLSDYLEIQCDNYRFKLETYSNMLSGKLYQYKPVTIKEGVTAKSLMLINQYNKKNPDLTSKQIDVVFQLRRFVKPSIKDNYDLADAFLIAEKTHQYVMLLIENYKTITQSLLQTLQAIDQALEVNKKANEKHQPLATFKTELSRVMLQFISRATIGKNISSLFGQTRPKFEPSSESSFINTKPNKAP